MKKSAYLRSVFLVVYISFAAFAHADDYDNFNSDGKDYSQFNSTREDKDDKYRDWRNTLSLLASRGINPDSIDWASVEESCSYIQNKVAGNAFNKCKYNNALIYSGYQKDKSNCMARAQQKYFEYMKENSATINNYVGTSPNNKKTSLSKSQEIEFKDSATVVCMNSMGWNDAFSWMAGKNMGKNRRN